MATLNAVPFRSTIFYTSAGTPAPTGSVLTVGSAGTQNFTSNLTLNSISMASTTISLGQSTNQTYTNFSNGSFTTGWASTLTGTTAIKKVVMGSNGATQTVLQGSTMSTVITSVNSGQTWSGSTTMGLPTNGTLAYQTYSSSAPTITAMSAAASSGNQLAIASNNTVYASANSGATFAPQGLGQNANPFIYLPFDGSSVADVMGNSAVTATGSIAYVTGKVGTNAVNLVNTAGLGASNYLRGAWTGSNAFTVSFWFNAQTVSVSQIELFMAYNGAVNIYINGSNYLVLTGAASNISSASAISANTWYNVVAVLQVNGVCSLYLNNSLQGSSTNSGGFGTSTGLFGLGTADSSTVYAFNGYLDDFRLYNYAVTNPSGAALIQPIVGPIMPYIYVTFDGSTTTDVMGNSSLTATNSPGFVAGQVGSNALDLSANPAGGSASKYVRGTWTGSSIFTVSFWFNTTAAGSSQVVFGSYANTCTLFINSSNQITFNCPTGGGTSVTSIVNTTAITTNTWYNVVMIFQTGSTCSLYVNGTLANSITNTSGVGTLTTTAFGLGTYDTATTSAFKGYIDDVRIYNGAFTPSQLSPVLSSPSFSTGSPNIYLPFENGSVLDVMGYSAISARGTMNFVPGVVGTSALNLVNPAGGVPTNYVSGSWAGSNNFTISLWVNIQSFGANNQYIFTSASGNLSIQTSGQLLQFYTVNTTSIYTSFNISLNTWYNVVAIYQASGTCSFYVNNVLMGQSTSSGVLSFGTTFNIGYSPFLMTQNMLNGYIDDLKIYNCAIPFSALGPMNYTQAAISNTGAYQLIAAANGGVYLNGSQVAIPQPQAAVNTVGGQVITPQVSSLAANTWTQNGVNWVASASSNLSAGYPAYGAFNNYYVISGVYSWASATTYSGSSPFAYTGAVSTTIIGVGAVSGEWLQLQTSIPLVMSTYTFACGGYLNIPKIYYIAGSTDGATWYPIQYASMTTNPLTANATACTTYLTVNQSGTQTIQGGTTGSGSFTPYATSTQAYTYFRIMATNVFGNGTLVELGEWYTIFATPATPLYVAPTTALLANLTTINVMPQQTGLASSTWTTNGISWVASASSVNTPSGGQIYYAFDNNSPNRWVPNSGAVYTTTANTSGVYTTVLGGVGSIQGDWLQLQSSIPLVMNSYQFATGYITTGARVPKILYIVGSNDGSSWYPIQYATGTGNPTMTPFYLIPGPIVVNLASTQIYGAGTLATTTYTTTTTPYLYFRLITVAMYTTSADTLDIGEWFVNFTAYTPSLVQALTVSPTGQYMTVTGTGATSPQLTGLAASTWTANGVNWTASASSNLNASFFPYGAFNNYVGSIGGTYSWCSASSIYSASTGLITGTAVSTTVLGGIGAVSGEWLQIQSSVPVILSSYTYESGGNTNNNAKTYYIVGSTDGTSWYPVQYASMTTNPNTSQVQSCSTYINVSQSGVQTIVGGQIGSGTFTTYATTTNAYNYFRFIGTSVYAGGGGNYQWGQLFLNFQSGPSYYSTNYGSTWTTALSAATLPNANLLATSGNGQYSLQGYGQTVTVVSNYSTGYSTGSFTTPVFTPALSVSVGPVNCASISATGQYMSILIQSTTYNVYYSTNYGATFTGITVGSSLMMSCAMSADGSYLTVASATQVYTLNLNTQGYAVTLGNAAGVVNQALNAIAIGNQAGVTNQSANSIVLNASGAALNAYLPGLFVAPIAGYGASTTVPITTPIVLLGYGTDNQVTQSNVTLNGNGVFVSSYAPLGNAAGTYDIMQRWSESVIGNYCNVDLMWIRQTASTNWTTTSQRFQAKVDGTWQGFLEFNGTNNNYGVTIGAGGDTSNPNNVPGRLYVASNGNVGIGVVAPNTYLCVGPNGGVNQTTNIPGISMTSVSGSNMHYSVGQDSTHNAFFRWIYNATATSGYGSLQTYGGSNPLCLQDQGGNVGIGTATPAQLLHVNGTISFAPNIVTRLYSGVTPVSANWDYYASSIGNTIWNGSAWTSNFDGGSGYGCCMMAFGWRTIYFCTNVTSSTTLTDAQMVASTRMTITSGGYVGIGTAPSYQLHLSSDSAAKPSTSTWTVSSDERLKDNIVLADVDRCVEIIRAVPLKHYRWKDDVYTLDQVEDRSKLGWIAQDVEKVFPKAVGTHPFHYNQVYEDVVQDDGSTIKTLVSEDVIEDCRDLNADQLYAVMYGAIQKLISENDAQTQKLNSLLAWAQTQGFSG